MRNKYKNNNIARQRSGRRLWNLLKRKFYTEPVAELTIDEYDVPVASEKKKWIVEYVPSESEKLQDELEPICPLFKDIDEDARYDRHMKPIRELQAINSKVLKSKEEL